MNLKILVPPASLVFLVWTISAWIISTPVLASPPSPLDFRLKMETRGILLNEITQNFQKMKLLLNKTGTSQLFHDDQKRTNLLPHFRAMTQFLKDFSKWQEQVGEKKVENGRHLAQRMEELKKMIQGWKVQAVRAGNNSGAGKPSLSLTDIYRKDLQELENEIQKTADLFQVKDDQGEARSLEILAKRAKELPKLTQDLLREMGKIDGRLATYEAREKEFIKKTPGEISQVWNHFLGKEGRVAKEIMKEYLAKNTPEGFENKKELREKAQEMEKGKQDYLNKRSQILSRFLQDYEGDLSEFSEVAVEVSGKLSGQMDKFLAEDDVSQNREWNRVEQLHRLGEEAIARRNEDYLAWVENKFLKERLDSLKALAAAEWEKWNQDILGHLKGEYYESRESWTPVISKLDKTREKWKEEQVANLAKLLGPEFVLPGDHLAKNRLEEETLGKARKLVEAELKAVKGEMTDLVQRKVQENAAAVEGLKKDQFDRFKASQEEYQKRLDKIFAESQEEWWNRAMGLWVENHEDFLKIYGKEWKEWPKNMGEWNGLKKAADEKAKNGQTDPMDARIEQFQRELMEKMVKEFFTAILKKSGLPPKGEILKDLDANDQEQLIDRIEGNLARMVERASSKYLLSKRDILELKKKVVAFKELHEEEIAGKTQGEKKQIKGIKGIKGIFARPKGKLPSPGVEEEVSAENCHHKVKSSFPNLEKFLGQVNPLADYDDKNKIKGKAKKQESKKGTCSFCFEDDRPLISAFQCEHWVCDNCEGLQNFIGIQEKDRQALVCPMKDCGAPLNFSLMLKRPNLISQRQLFDHYSLYWEKLVKSDPHWLDCRSVECRGGNLDHHPDKSRFECPLCHCNYCKKCPERHDKFTTCEKYRELMADGGDPLKGEREAGRLKKCPNPAGCENWISKGQGCLHMTCDKCRYEFNWETLAPWSGVAWYAQQNGQNIDPNLDMGAAPREREIE